MQKEMFFSFFQSTCTIQCTVSLHQIVLNFGLFLRFFPYTWMFVHGNWDK